MDEPIHDAAERFGVDALRLFYAHIASLYVDVVWEDDRVENYRDRLVRIWSQVEEALSVGSDEGTEMDAWLAARTKTRLASLRSYMAEYDVRSYSNEVYFEMPQDLRWYLRRGGRSRGAIRDMLEAWVTLMAPVTPHTAEELWESLGNERFVSLRQIPEVEVTDEVLTEEAKEKLVEGLAADVSEILKVTGVSPSKLVVTVAPSWKREMLKDALSKPKGQLDISSLIKSAMAKAKDGSAKKEVPAYAKELASAMGRSSEQERKTMSLDIDELSALRSALPFLAQQFGCDVEVYSADDEAKYDPKGKARFARPGRPAVDVE